MDLVYTTSIKFIERQSSIENSIDFGEKYKSKFVLLYYLRCLSYFVNFTKGILEKTTNNYVDYFINY
ncbi:MAG: hypothetical protein RR262_04050 [Clostridium sp.]